MAQATEVQKLRELTGAGVMACKKALEDAAGNFDKAVSLIRERGFAKVKEKEGRETKAGVIKAYVHNDRVGTILELNSETDFVARSDPFRELAHNLAMQIVAMAPKDIEELLTQPYIRDEKVTVKDLIQEMILKTGENIKISKFTRYHIQDG